MLAGKMLVCSRSCGKATIAGCLEVWWASLFGPTISVNPWC